MNRTLLTPRQLRLVLPTLLLGALALTLVVSSTAVAEEPPIVTVGPVDAGGTSVSGSAGSDPQANACIGDDHSGANPGNPDPVQLNDSSCTSGAGGGAQPSGAAGTTGSAATSGSAGKASTRSSVGAADAIGLRIVGVKRLLGNVRVSRNFRLLVTVQDGRGLRVRSAIVSVSRVPGSTSTVSGLHAAFSNKLGVARVLVPVTKKMLGSRLFLKITARTPRAKAVTLRSVLLPRLR